MTYPHFGRSSISTGRLGSKLRHRLVHGEGLLEEASRHAVTSESHLHATMARRRQVTTRRARRLSLRRAETISAAAWASSPRPV
jgi:hypothetical protein